MPFVDLSGQQVNTAPTGSDTTNVNNAPAAPTVPVSPTPASAPSPVQSSPAQDQDKTELNSIDNIPTPPNELNSLNMNAGINSDAIKPEETEDAGPSPLKTAKDEVELDIDAQGVKSMTGPALNGADAASKTTAQSPVSTTAPVGTTSVTTPETAPANTPLASADAAGVVVPSPAAPGLPPLPAESTQSAGGLAIATPDTDPAALMNQESHTPTGTEETTSAAAPVASEVSAPEAAPMPEQAPLSSPQEVVATGDLMLDSNSTVPTEELADEGDLPAESSIEDLTNLALERKASDIHFATNYPVMLRVDGDLIPVTKRISAAQAKALTDALLVVPEKKAAYEKEKEVDFSFTNSTGTRFRVNLYTERGNAAGALRLIATKIRTIEELELPEIFYEIIKEPHGLVLLVGPTGSGKSTTLAAMLNHINLNRREHILTIEDPIEYVYPIGKSIVDQRELEADTMSWGRALKSALREDPNVVLVGEMRDLDTISSTITVAETGHLVFATLHTNSASQAIDRIIDVFPEGAKAQIRAQLANVISAVISQRLIPVKQGGRRAALEIMLGTPAVKNAIREGKTYQIDNIIQTSGDLGMMTLEKSLVDMVRKGYISKEQAKENSVKPDDIESLLAKTF